MRRQDILSILVTFIVGFFGGGFLYVTHFARLVNPDSVATQAEAAEFSIVGEAYGGCRDVCPSFQVLKDGSYRYQFFSDVDREKQLRQGTLPFDVQQAVKRSLDTETLVDQSQTIEPANCNSYTDGIDVKYQVTFEGAEYTLDSCGTAVDGEGEAWNSLAKIWNYFQTIK